MAPPENLAEYRELQRIAKSVLAAIGSSIQPEDTERTLVARAIALLEERGIHDTWYHQCPVLVLAGSRSCQSISGRDYEPADEAIGEFNLVTVDVSPARGEIWGDCARSFCVEQGVLSGAPQDDEIAGGLALEETLHHRLLAVARPDTPVSVFYRTTMEMIENAGYVNLDFLRNLGHSIELHRAERIFLAGDCRLALGDLGLFTFEPHICRAGGKWEIKKENIHFFDEDGVLREL